MATKQIDNAKVENLINPEFAKKVLKHIEESSIVLRVSKRYPIGTKKQRIPAQDTLAVAGFITGEDAYFPTTDASFKGKYLTVEKIGAIVIANNDDLADAQYDFEELVITQVREAIGSTFDAAVLFGVNKPSTWDDGIVQQAISAGNTVTESASVYTDIFAPNGALDLVERDGFMVDHIVSWVGQKAVMRNMKDANDLPFYTDYVKNGGDYVIEGAKVHFLRNGAFDTSLAKMIFGDFQQLIHAIRKDFTVKKMTEATITDGLGNNYYLGSQDKTGWRFVFRVAWTCPNPTNRLNGDEGTRFPFSVIVPAV